MILNDKLGTSHFYVASDFIKFVYSYAVIISTRYNIMFYVLLQILSRKERSL